MSMTHWLRERSDLAAPLWPFLWARETRHLSFPDTSLSQLPFPPQTRVIVKCHLVLSETGEFSPLLRTRVCACLLCVCVGPTLCPYIFQTGLWLVVCVSMCRSAFVWSQRASVWELAMTYYCHSVDSHQNAAWMDGRARPSSPRLRCIVWSSCYQKKTQNNKTRSVLSHFCG